MTDQQVLDHLKMGFACDDYHRLIAERTKQHYVQIGRLVDYVEVGTLTGNSAEAVLATCVVRRAVLIDNFSLSWNGEKQSKQKIETRLAKYYGLFEVIEGDSRQILPRITEKFDVGFVDGDHEADSCRIDLTNMLPRMNPDGVIFVHDVGNESFTHLLPVVAAFAKENHLSMTLHDVMDGLAELRHA